MDKIIRDAMGKNKKITAILIAVVIVGLLLGVMLTKSISNAKETDTVIQGSVKTTDVSLNSMLEGYVSEIYVEEGQEVKAGEVIMKMDSETVQAKLAQAEAAKAAASAVAQKAANGARSQEVIQAKAAFDYASKMYERMKTLLAEEAISQASFDQVEVQYIAARETYNMALEGARNEDVTAANSQVAQAEGAIAEVNSYLEKAEIKAPADGVITTINVKAGELISTGMPVVTLTTNEEPWVEFNIDETNLGKIKEGQEVELTFPAYPDRKYVGEIATISKKADFATKKATNENGSFDILTYGVKVTLKDMEEPLYSGMTVMVNHGK